MKSRVGGAGINKEPHIENLVNGGRKIHEAI
jgi:hypothetical protein